MSIENPLISVIVPTYNNARLLPQTLKSILDQSYLRLEVIVVNDGSTDETSAVLESLRGCDRLVVCEQSNQGDIAARNRGIEICGGALVAFCDSDDIWEKDHLTNLERVFRNNAQLGMAFDNVLYFTDQDRAPSPGTEEFEKSCMIGSEQAGRLAKSPVPLRAFFDDNLITTSCSMVRRSVFDRVGTFDRNIYLMNDLHLFYRIGAHFEVRFVDYVGVRKRVHETNLTVIHPHYEFGVNCLENIKSHYPEVYRKIGPRRFQTKLAKKYLRLARYYRRMGQTRKSVEMFKNAAACRPLNLRYRALYVAALLCG